MKFPTRKQLKRMSPAEREALVKQLEEEMERRGQRYHGWASAMSEAANKLGHVGELIHWSALPWKWIGLSGLAFLLAWALLIIVTGLLGGAR
jgi:hypothetical protein